MDSVMAGVMPTAESSTENADSNAREFGDELTKTRKVARPATSTATGIGATTGITRRAPPKVAQVKGAGNNGGFSIFIDTENSSAAAPGGAWDSLPGEKERSKENQRSASNWTKEQAGTVPQKRARPVAAAGAVVPKAGVDFEMFVDTDKQEQAPKPQERKGVRLQLDGALGQQRDRDASLRQARPLDFLAQNESVEDTRAAAQNIQDNASQDFCRPPSEKQAHAEGEFHEPGTMGFFGVSSLREVARKMCLLRVTRTCAFFIQCLLVSQRFLFVMLCIQIYHAMHLRARMSGMYMSKMNRADACHVTYTHTRATQYVIRKHCTNNRWGQTVRQEGCFEESQSRGPIQASQTHQTEE